jgi:hypothetical protein
MAGRPERSQDLRSTEIKLRKCFLRFDSVRKCFLRFVQILTSADHAASAHLTIKNASAEASCVFTSSQLHPRAALSACGTVAEMEYIVRSFHA